MQTIGNFLKKERISRKVSLEDLERKTKIRKEILGLIEEEKWDSLPEYPVVLGFVKNISKSLKLEVDRAAALLRRDYPPKIISLKKQEPVVSLRRRFIWSPKTTFVFISVLVGLLIFSYILYQLKIFSNPPSLEVYAPKDGQVLNVDRTEVVGKTSPQATVEIDGLPVEVSKDGSFKFGILLGEGEKMISIRAKSRSGKVREIVRRVIVERKED